MVISYQQTAMLLRENRNEAKNNMILHQKNAINQSIFMEQEESDTGKNRGNRNINVNQFKNYYRNHFFLMAKVTIVRNCISTLINFENSLLENIGKKH